MERPPIERDTDCSALGMAKQAHASHQAQDFLYADVHWDDAPAPASRHASLDDGSSGTLVDVRGDPRVARGPAATNKQLLERLPSVSLDTADVLNNAAMVASAPAEAEHTYNLQSTAAIGTLD